MTPPSNPLHEPDHPVAAWPLLAACLLLASLCGCGSAKRLLGKENILPREGTLLVTTLEAERIAGSQVTFIASPNEDFRADPTQLLYRWEFAEGTDPFFSTLPEPAVEILPVTAARKTVTGNKLTLTYYDRGVKHEQTYPFEFEVVHADPLPPAGAQPVLITGKAATGNPVTFALDPSVSLTGLAQLKYEWVFPAGDAVTAAQAGNSSTAEAPKVTLGELAGRRTGYLTLSATQDGLPFTRDYTFSYEVVDADDPFPPDGKFNFSPDATLVAGTTALFSVPDSLFLHQSSMDYRWDFKDGAAPQHPTGRSVEVTLPAASSTPYTGALHVSLAVAENGQLFEYAGDYTFDYLVSTAGANPDPLPDNAEFNFAPNVDLAEGTEVTFAVPDSFFADQAGMAYTWRFNDGATPPTKTGRSVTVILLESRDTPYTGTLHVKFTPPGSTAIFEHTYTFHYLVTPGGLRVTAIQPATAAVDEVITLMAALTGNPEERQVQYQWTIGTLGTVEPDSGLDRPAPRVRVAAPSDNGAEPDDLNPVPVTVRVWFAGTPETAVEFTGQVSITP